jgi:hypothetical protein
MLRLLFALLVLTTPVVAQDVVNRLRADIQYLAAPELTGRAPGTEGNEKAAAYIEKAFSTIGLSPAGTQGFRQPFQMTTGVALGAKNSVSFDVLVERQGVPIEKTRPTKISWKLGEDYQPYGFSESGSVTGPVVFAGYGLSIHEKGYDDYAGIDVKGRIVLVFAGTPPWAEKDEVFRTAAAIRTKATVARERGAAAIVIVKRKGDSSDVLSRFGLDRLGKNSGIIALEVRRTPCARIFPPKETSLFVAEGDIDKKKKPHSFELKNVTATISAELAFTESTTSNVIGFVPGTDPVLKNEFLVVGGHYDHIGMGDENSLHSSREPIVHPGADDNASGTAGVIELARRFAANPTPRSVLFMTYSGEEKGLLGSKHWTTTPTKPLESIVAMINMDMIGRLKDNKLNVQGTGTSPSWDSVIIRAKAGTNFVVSTTADGFGPSDHSSFFAKNIPVLFFFTGLHTDYHRPTDTHDKINVEGEAQLLDVVERAAREIASMPQRPAFTMTAQPAKATSGGFRVTFGIIPDYSDDPQGLRITGVRAGTPADKGGLKADDIITKFDGVAVKNIYDLTAALTKCEPGQTVNIDLIRDGEAKTVKVTLTGR